MSKLTKQQIKSHDTAIRLLNQDRISDEDKLYIFQNFRADANHIHPIQTKTAYMQSMAQEVLDTMYQGSVTKFFAALCGDTPLSAKDRKELKAWLDKEM